MKKRDRWVYQLQNGEVALIGAKPSTLPYLRVGTLDGKMIGSLEGNTLLCLARAIFKAMRVKS